MTSELETRRFLLRPLVVADAAQIQVIFPEWEIVKYLNNKVPWPYPPDGALTYIREMALPEIERGVAWYWTIRMKSAPEKIIGFISLRKSDNVNRGFWLVPPWHEQGLMSEACDAGTDYWFNALKFPVLRAQKAIANTGSRRISEKQGMRMVSSEEHDYVCGRLPGETWEITAEEWNARKRKADVNR